ncbi:hypothetical protein PO909_028795 [Leuciscus waleckii]
MTAKERGSLEENEERDLEEVFWRKSVWQAPTRPRPSRDRSRDFKMCLFSSEVADYRPHMVLVPLKGQLRSVQEELDSLEEEKASELWEAQEELRVAQEEVQELQQAAEEAAAERENDIALLQEELCRVRAELERLRGTTQEYELELTTLRAEISMKNQRRAGGEGCNGTGDMDQLIEECRSLKDECQTLKNGNMQLSEKLEMLEQQRASSADSCLALEAEQNDGEKDTEKEVKAEGFVRTLEVEGGNWVDAYTQKNISFEGKPVTPTGRSGGFSEVFSLRDQLKQAEERASQVQREWSGIKGELVELQGLYESSQRERAELEAELQRCRAELEGLSAFENALYMTNVLHVGSTTAEVTVCPTTAPVFQSASCLTKPLRHFRSSMYVSLWVAFCPVTHIDSGLRVFSHLVFVKPLAANVFC